MDSVSNCSSVTCWMCKEGCRGNHHPGGNEHGQTLFVPSDSFDSVPSALLVHQRGYSGDSAATLDASSSDFASMSSGMSKDSSVMSGVIMSEGLEREPMDVGNDKAVTFNSNVEMYSLSVDRTSSSVETVSTSNESKEDLTKREGGDREGGKWKENAPHNGGREPEDGFAMSSTTLSTGRKVLTPLSDSYSESDSDGIAGEEDEFVNSWRMGEI